MGNINWLRVLLGGLLCGLIINIGEAIGGVVFAEEWGAAFAKLGVDMKAMEQDLSLMAMFLGGGFLFGLVCIFLYAAIRPRFGPGPKTAVIAAMAVWIVGYFWPTIGFGAIGLWPMSLAWIGVVQGLVEIVAGTLAGAWIYKEE
jgi:hypothetical protein